MQKTANFRSIANAMAVFLLSLLLVRVNMQIFSRLDRWYRTFEIQDPLTYYTAGKIMPFVRLYVINHFILFALLWYALSPLLSKIRSDMWRRGLRVLGGALLVAVFFLTLEAPFFSLSAQNPKSLTFHPRLTCTLTPGYSRNESLAINSLGFRGREISRRKPAGAVRIAVLGDSALFGAGVSQLQTTPWLLEEKLRKALPGRAVEVVNAAVPGYSSADGVYVLRNAVLPLEPDVVLAGFNNDCDSAWMEDRERFQGDAGRDITAFLSERSRFFRIASEAQVTEFPPAPPNVDPAKKVRRVSLDDHGKNIEELARLCSSRAVPLVVLGMPDYHAPGGTTRFVKVPPEYRERERDVCAAVGARYLDFAALWKNADSTLFFPDMYHLNPRGCAKMAQDIAAFLEKERLLAPGAGAAEIRGRSRP